jgi:uncharacterized membrane protein
MKSHWKDYEEGFEQIIASPAQYTRDRDLIASVLLDAVEQSFRAYDRKARSWLSSIYAQSLFILLDISPEAALQHLVRKWQLIDDAATTPPPGSRTH